jgi:hypothetical protein
MAKRDLDELRIGDGAETSRNRGASEALPSLPRTARGSARWRTILARAAAPVLAAFALGVVLFGSNRDTDYELQLISADAAQPGQDLPMRALLYEKLRSIEGPQLGARVLDVQLEDRSGVARARAKLTPSRGGLGDIEGSLHIPADLHGEYQLRASVQVDTIRVEVEKPLTVGKPTQLPVSGRPLRALQQFSEGPLQAEPGELPADALRVRVGGGACVPEEECRIYVYVGSRSVRVWVEGNSAVTPQGAAAQPPNPGAALPIANIERDSLVQALSIVTHGPEAQLWLRASRIIGGAQVGRRSVRLPIALGASALRLKSPVVLEGHPLSFQLLGGDGGCILDLFRDEEWIRTTSAPSCTQPQPLAALPPGVYRLQGRRDPFSSATAGVAIAQVVGRNDGSFELEVELANRVLHLEPNPLAYAKLARAADTDFVPGARRVTDPVPFDDDFGYFAAILESGIIELPRAASGYAAMLERLSQTQAQLRSLSILALVLGAISLALAVGRSGLRAVAQADAILRDAGHTGPVRRRARARSMLSLALSVLSLMLVFVVLGAYVVARGGP